MEAAGGPSWAQGTLCAVQVCVIEQKGYIIVFEIDAGTEFKYPACHEAR